MHLGRTTLSKFLIQQLDGFEDSRALGALLVDVAAAIKAIAAMSAKGALGGYLGAADSRNAQGEAQKKLDLLANEAMLRGCEWGGLVAGMVSEELAEPYPVPAAYAGDRYLLVFDPLDGSSNTDVNISIGTIFSVLRHGAFRPPRDADYLKPGSEQVAAGYAIYGPATMLVLTVGRGVHGFTLDREIGNFILTHPDLSIAPTTSEFAINASNARFWEPPVHRYVAECQAGPAGARGRDFNMRWNACLVAEVHRILMRGGIYLYPRDSKDAAIAGRLRLLYEANPMGMLVEQAGGRASTGRIPLLDLRPEGVHQRVPVILGSRDEVERIERFHAEHDAGDDEAYVSPLFNDRSLYRPEARV